LEITKTVLSLILIVVITILTTLTTIAGAYAGGDHDDNGNKQKAEDESAAAIADCDDNEVERAGFDCIAIAANDVEIETQEEPPEEEPTLSVCKEVNDPNQEVEPNDFVFEITTGPNTITIEGQPPGDCQPVGDVFPGEYTVIEEVSPGSSQARLNISRGWLYTRY
jgi:hypothetical protein